SFLTKHLLVDWRIGERYFAEKLLDYDLASNNAGWQWSAGTGCDAAPYFRIFNPDEQLRKFDPEKKFVLRWAPEYAGPLAPPRIVEHAFARQRALKNYQSVLKVSET
ncbi:MAG: FAD-binding domain-containing protein, partial [Bacteroidia bacterium]|nr:FAD-binding domain-containing protein [Bacteroidia bacterium]MDW8334825.1 FAD-binding domain-containing protein [Bacteroidia bacterium]